MLQTAFVLTTISADQTLVFRLKCMSRLLPLQGQQNNRAISEGGFLRDASLSHRSAARTYTVHEPYYPESRKAGPQSGWLYRSVLRSIQPRYWHCQISCVSATNRGMIERTIMMLRFFNRQLCYSKDSLRGP